MCQTSEYYIYQMEVLFVNIKVLTTQIEEALDRDRWSPDACDSAMLGCFSFYAEMGETMTAHFRMISLLALADPSKDELIRINRIIREYKVFWNEKTAVLTRRLQGEFDEMDEMTEHKIDFDWSEVLGDQFN